MVTMADQDDFQHINKQNESRMSQNRERVEEALSINALRAQKALAAIFVSYESGGLRVFSWFVRFLVKTVGINSKKCIEYGK